MIGQILGHYRILEKVAAGGMGVVYRARDEQLDRDVAVKVLPAGTLSDETARKHFRKEAMALAKLNHPNIETVYDFCTQDGLDFLVMEYIPGKTLADRLAVGTLPEKDAVNIGIQIVSALEEAHDRGIVHRDLKPANIAITVKGYAKILDFGLAKLLPLVEEGTTENLSDTQAAAGTVPYMPPEQLKGEPVDARADIYAIGAVLYEMSTGRRTFQEELPSRLIDAILHRPPVPPRAFNPRISPEFETSILKCLDKDPDRRYQSAKELLVDLRRLQAITSGSGVLPPIRVAFSVRRARRKRIIYSMAGLLLLAAGLLAFNVGGWRDRLLGRPRPMQIRSLAVLPFENLSGDPNQDYFADGITEALITDLSQIHTLRVISRTSVMRYKSERKPLSQIARELHVDGIVEGSASRIDTAAQISAHLLHGPTDTLLWSKSYKRELQNVFALQAEVASAIVREINLTLTPQEAARLAGSRPVNPAAHEAYLRGRYLINGNSSQQRQAREYFEQALRIDPSYAPAYAGLADYYLSPEVRPLVSMPQAKQFARQALDLDSDLAEAHVELALIHFYADWDWAAADREFKLAIQLNPGDAEAHRSNSYFLSALGHADLAQAESYQAQQLDPLSIWTQITAGYVLYYSRKYDEAVAQCRRALEWDPHSAGAYDCLGASYLARGMYEQAIAASSKASELSNNDPARLVGLGRAYALAQRPSDARKILAQLREVSSRTYVPPYFFATIYAALHQNDEAFASLQEAIQERDGYLVWLRADAAVDPIREDSRFHEILAHVGI